MATETFLNGRVSLCCGDSWHFLKDQPDNRYDSVVTDPPYALVSMIKRFGNAEPSKEKFAMEKSHSGYMSRGFMGQKWDNGSTVHAVEFWAEVLRVLKPGGHVVSFGGTRTYHRMACAIEDAGFEIRDMLQWIFATGFPKSHNVGKGIDRAAGIERKIVTTRKLTGKARVLKGGNYDGGYEGRELTSEYSVTVPSTEEAILWDGFGTALKPACEPICLARKPLEEGLTVAANVLKWGTGALNIDGCRVDASAADKMFVGDGAGRADTKFDMSKGRWPANVCHDGSDEVVSCFPVTDPSTIGKPRGAKAGNGWGMTATGTEYEDGGSAARFFYSAKADSDDRLGSKHPTVKPVDLMQWLVRLVTPPGGLCLDPFAGTGTTAEACYREGMRCMLIEREAEYQSDIRRRMALVMAGPNERRNESIKAKTKGRKPDHGPLFSEQT